jgi:hypothetical protein
MPDCPASGRGFEEKKEQEVTYEDIKDASSSWY